MQTCMCNKITERHIVQATDQELDRIANMLGYKRKRFSFLRESDESFSERLLHLFQNNICTHDGPKWQGLESYGCTTCGKTLGQI